MQSQFQAAINQLVAEKNLPKEVVFDAIKAAMKAAFRKDYGNKESEYEVELSDSGENTLVYQLMNVVKKVENEFLEISVKEAAKYKKGAKEGDVVRIDVTPMEFGRIAAQSAKQVIIQRLQDAERDLMYETFKHRENELINAQIHRVQNDHVYIDLGKITIELLKEYQIPGERYYGGQRVKLYLDKVLKTSKGPKLLISRTHPKLVEKLFELEIPEVAQGIVKVHAVAREAGVRTKIAMSSNDPKIDPIGSCVGQKGVRIQSVMDELNGERIDVILFTEDKYQFLKQALSPAKITYIDLNETSMKAKVYVEEDQRPLAIGRSGQNVRIASRLTGFEIDVLDVADLSEEDKAKMSKADVVVGKSTPVKSDKVKVLEVQDLGLDQKYIDALVEANLTQAEQLKGLSIADLQTIEGINSDGAKAIHDVVKKKIK